MTNATIPDNQEIQMTFTSDSDVLTTYDIERGYELFKRGGGSDGDCVFLIRSLTGEFTFHAQRGQRKFTDEEIRIYADAEFPVMGTWRVRLVEQSSPWAPIIREALASYKFVHGLPVWQPYEVEL